MIKLRLARHGAKGRPYYWLVAADVRSPRDGSYLEKLGTYNPMLPQDNESRVSLNADRIKYYLGVGAQPTERVALFLAKAGLIPPPVRAVRPQRSRPGEKMQARKDKKHAGAANPAA